MFKKQFILNVKKSYKLTKRTTKTEKNEKSWKILKIYNILNFKTILYKVTFLGNKNHSIFNHKLMRLVNTLRLPKELKKTGKKSNFKKMSEKIFEAIKK